MATNQEGVHAAVRAQTGTTLNYQGDWHALFDDDSIASGTFNERLLAWINAQLSTSYTSLPQAMQAFAEDQGFDSWSAMNTFELFSVSDLFASGEDGAWYDPSDLTSMYVGRKGTGGNPGVGDVVGVILDKAQMGGDTAATFIAGQPELVTNGTFDTDLTGWSDVSQPTGTATWSAGAVTLFNPASSSTRGRVQQAISTTVGESYLVTFEVLSGTVTLNVPPESDVLGYGVGTHSRLVTATSTTLTLGFEQTYAGTSVVDNVSVKALPGNHAVAPSDAARPVLRQDGSGYYYLDFDGTDDYLSSDFALNQPVTYAVAITSVGAATDDEIIGGGTGDASLKFTSATTVAVYPGTTATSTVTVNDEATVVLTGYNDGASSSVALNGGTPVTGSPAGTTDPEGITIAAEATPSQYAEINVYGVVVIGRALTAAETDSVESYLASKSGVTLS